MIRSIFLAALLAVPASAKKEKDEYARLKPLYGSWDVARDCVSMKDRMYVEIVRLNNAVRATYFESAKKTKNLGKSEIFYNAEADRFKIFTYIPQLTQMLGIQAIPGTLSVDGPEDEQPGLIRINAHYSVVDGALQLKLKEKNKQATFTLRGKSPLGTMNCTGAGVKVADAPAAPAAQTKPAKRAATADD